MAEKTGVAAEFKINCKCGPSGCRQAGLCSGLRAPGRSGQWRSRHELGWPLPALPHASPAAQAELGAADPPQGPGHPGAPQPAPDLGFIHSFLTKSKVSVRLGGGPTGAVAPAAWAASYITPTGWPGCTGHHQCCCQGTHPRDPVQHGGSSAPPRLSRALCCDAARSSRARAAPSAISSQEGPLPPHRVGSSLTGDQLENPISSPLCVPGHRGHLGWRDE